MTEIFRIKDITQSCSKNFMSGVGLSDPHPSVIELSKEFCRDKARSSAEMSNEFGRDEARSLAEMKQEVWQI